MSGTTLGCINASENEFLAEEELVTIMSGIRCREFRFLSGNFGPLIAGMPCVVPLWFAITLRKRGKCTIQVPEWMVVAELERCIEQEKNNDKLGEIPFHYMEIAQLILHHAKSDIPNAEQVAVLLRDLENVRMDRIRIGVDEMAKQFNRGDNIRALFLNNIGALEVFSIQRVILGTLSGFYKLDGARDSDDAGGGGGGGGGGDTSGRRGGRRLGRRLL